MYVQESTHNNVPFGTWFIGTFTSGQGLFVNNLREIRSIGKYSD